VDTVDVLNPIEHPEWDKWVGDFTEASFFHTSAWARVLCDTYGHQPRYFCQVQGSSINSVLPVMEINSRFLGRRAVSLPFSDFCNPLFRAGIFSEQPYQAALEYGKNHAWRSLECRSDAPWAENTARSLSFRTHLIKLGRSEKAQFGLLNPAVRRGVRKASSAGLRVDFQVDAESMRSFYRLHCQTRKRLGAPPQPVRFFENIQRHVLDKGLGFIAVVFLERRAIAALVFFHFAGKATYKFGASDLAYQSIRPNNLGMWEGIKQCVKLGLSELNLGRTSLSNEGLRRFKLGFGASENQVTYQKYDFAKQKFVVEVDRAESWVNNVFRHLPLPALRLAGQLLYPHLS
jgi:hypothetical protein